MKKLKNVTALLLCVVMVLSTTGCPHRGAENESARTYREVTSNYGKWVFKMNSGDFLPGKKNEIEFYCSYGSGGGVSITFRDVWIQAGGESGNGEYQITRPSSYGIFLGRDIKVGDKFNITSCKYMGNPWTIGYGTGSMLLEVTKLPTSGTIGELKVTYQFSPSN